MGTIKTLGAMSKSAMIASQILERANSHVVQDTATNCTKKLSHAVINSTV